MRSPSVALAFFASYSLCVLTSCGSARPGPVTIHLVLQGRAMGGEQPITAATIQLYAVGTSTDGGTAAALINQTTHPVTTSDGSGLMNSNANPGNSNNQAAAGFFNITGDYSCPYSGAMVYIASIGGNPGSGTNSAQEQVAALGQCGNLSASTSLVINEVTTVGTVAALHAYMSGYASMGSTPAHVAALDTAFATAAQYVNVTTGTAPGPSLPSGYNASDNDIRALANVVQACVNSTGGSSTPCTAFFAYARGTAPALPTDTVTALIDIFTTPTNSVANLFNLQGTTPAFSPTNASAPPDWTLPILQVPSTPVLSLATGTYNSVQMVTITDADTDGTARIYYTLDGSTPTAASTLYGGGPITIGTTQTLSAIDIDDSRLSSAVASATITISASIVPAVSLSSLSAPHGNSSNLTLQAFSNANGSTATFTLASGIGGYLTPSTCVIYGGFCTVTYAPSSIQALGAYPNALNVSFSAYGGYASASASNYLSIFSPDTESLLVNFTNQTGAAPGNQPIGHLIQASDGYFYGTTSYGGPNNSGTIFKVSPAGAYTLLWSFPSGSTNGSAPYGSLVQGTDGNFYGTTNQGGPNNDGTVYKFSPTGTYTLLHHFANSPTDGEYPQDGLVQGTDGNFYGTTSGGGTSTAGTFYQITSTGAFQVLHSFSSAAGNVQSPYSAVVQASDGYFYGSADDAIYKISSTGAFSLLYSTSSYPNPIASNRLIEGPGGNLYGWDEAGIFTIGLTGAPPATLSAYSGPYSGSGPSGGLLLASDGNLYGMTTYGGPAYSDLSNNFNSGYGTIFQVTPSGAYNLVHAFVNSTTDGNTPYGDLIQGNDGNFYGATAKGGYGVGTVVKLTPAATLSGPVTLTLPTSVAADSGFTLSYTVVNAYSATIQYCFATNTAGDTTGWTGIQTGSPTPTNITLTAPSTAGTYTYTLTCGGTETGLATLNVH